MYQDDREAMHQLAESATREAERLRVENEAMRNAVGWSPNAHIPVTMALPPAAVYTTLAIRALPLEERARLAMHSVRRFPVWLIGLLNLVTLGLFPLIHFSLLHDKLPKAAHDDPSGGKAIGFTFIPFYNLYWTFFNALRLCDRLTLQFKLRGLHKTAPRGMVLATCVVGVIPWLGIYVGLPIMWTIAVCLLQSSVNRVAALAPTSWDAGGDVASSSPPAEPAGLGYGQRFLLSSPEQMAKQARAQKLVNWSHVFGWGGLATLVLGTSLAIGVAGKVAGGIVGTTAFLAMIVGAILGQIGRAMQGRAI